MVYLHNPVIFRNVLLVHLGHWIPDKQYIKLKWQNNMDYPLDIDNPKTFNEKLNWLKLYDHRPVYTRMVDKYEAKKYVADIIGEEYIIPTLGVWDSPDKIDWDALPSQFVLKATHDSGGLVICKDKSKLDKKMAMKRLSKCLKYDYYKASREWPYKNVPRRIIAEQYMEDTNTKELRDYKFFCMDGVCKAMFIAKDRQNKAEPYFDFFDTDFRHLDIQQGHPNAPEPPAKPDTFEEMKRMAEKLTKGIPEARIDFYEVNGKAYFGEVTFFHFGGMTPFHPQSVDREWGEWITLPDQMGGVSI